MRLFSIGCRDSGNALTPMVTILRELKKFCGYNQFYAGDIEMLREIVFPCGPGVLAIIRRVP
jgi:hypothetical protein